MRTDYEELYLDVSGTSFDAFSEAVRNVEAEGIILTSLAEEQQQDPNCALELFSLAKEAQSSPTGTMDEFLQRFDRWDAVLIARLGGAYVGYTYLVPDPRFPERLEQVMTAVRPEHRRRGVATALKAKTLQYARKKGYTTIVTRIPKAPSPIQRLNEKLGYLRRVFERAA